MTRPVVPSVGQNYHFTLCFMKTMTSSLLCTIWLLALMTMGSGFELKMSMQANVAKNSDPLLVRAARGQKVERVPVWMMRQAGRHMKAYRDLCATHKTFRDRSENVDVATEISLQPYRAYGTDGCILFSDILTPLPAMGVKFDILESSGPKIKPFSTKEDVSNIQIIDPVKHTPFVGKILNNLRKEVDQNTAVLGFIGLPFTIACYLVEGEGTSEYKKIKSMMYNDPTILHTLLYKLAENLALYANYQIDNGAQVIQIFDSWAGVLSPEDYENFALPYQQIVVRNIKQLHPDVPLILYINRAGALLESLPLSGADVISLDWTTNTTTARQKFGPDVGIQGNLDPMVLFGPNEVIVSKTTEILKSLGGHRHIMNLGHGIDSSTSEEKAKLFVDTVKSWSPAAL